MARVRWYLGYKCRKNPQELVKNISQKVQEFNLSQYIPLLRLEKRVKPRGEFYFFIAIESLKKGEIPENVTDSNLLKLDFFKTPAVHMGISFTYEQIKPMVGAAHDVHDYTNPIPYQPLPKIICENPFELTAKLLVTNYSPPDVDVLSHRYEQLLYWLSALGYGTWESFKKACETLNIEEPKRVLRRLKLLGHIEASPDGTRWSIAPSTLVSVNSKSDFSFLLCGQRSIKLLDNFKQHADLKQINQPRGDAPPCIFIQIDNSNNILTLLEKISAKFSLTNAGEVSKQLANMLPNIETWKRNLRNLQGIVTSCYEWERFDGNDFVPCAYNSESGMYRMYNRQISLNPLGTLFYDAECNCWLQGDWYGVRFLALQQMGDKCIFNYDYNNKQLAILASQRLPEIYERALVLASGILPTYIDSWLLYANIEPEVVHLLSAKLNLICY